MEGKEMVKVEEDPTRHSLDPADLLTDMLDFGDDQKSSLGFMELLGIQDQFSTSILDILGEEPLALAPPVEASKIPAETSEVINTPATPNSSSVSSVSSGAEQSKVVDGLEDEGQKTKQQLKPKKTSQKKKQKEPRFAFMTKSEVDHLEDGYRWRKYGQKAVKNSPFPRSYYRCTNASCNVKKRVERCFNDPSVVVTTYEGQHTHQSPVMPRGSPVGFPPPSGNISAAAFPPPEFNSMSVPFNCGYNYNTMGNSPANPKAAFGSPAGNALLGDNGLLQDIVPAFPHGN